ncbi:sushi, von Willebrand factor type a, egf and pentraxin domain-containing protein 1 [Plakobranchus ocellatus]|uniref:Sushi, von Willebrand factor type a, egf and pentraxin domain-containing protein 1 n=1 Tax=Plakobranchus ocellatus TaxID=259542 RepID=A0AAV4CFD5_9GAST|nr:sushi, von Willebrand factor type a, egf and pentraxin domain-containing protein 1 [Plakobranchus ocellatus]
MPEARPAVTLTISSLNRDTESTVLLHAYRSLSEGYFSTVITGPIGIDNIFSHTFTDTEDFVSDSGLGYYTTVLTSDMLFVVSFTYTFPQQNKDLFTSSILYALGPASTQFFVVTSTSACEDLATVENFKGVNPLSSNPNCSCETYLLLVAVEKSVETDVTFEFPPGTKFTFATSDFEVSDPTLLKITLQQYQTVFIRSESDLSGTFIDGSQNMVVFTGYSIKVESPSGTEIGEIYLPQAGDIREFSLPNTELFIIESNLSVLVYRLSFAAPDASTGLNTVILPCLAPIFSKFSITNVVEHVLSRPDLDYMHLVVKEEIDPKSDLEINGMVYNSSRFSHKVFQAPTMTAVRLNVTGLSTIQVSRTSGKGVRAAAIVCAGKTGASGYCTDAESRHFFTGRRRSSVNPALLSSRDFHVHPISPVQFGFDTSKTSRSGSTAQTFPEQKWGEIKRSTNVTLQCLERIIVKNFTVEEVEQITSEIRAKLQVNVRETSAHVRKYTSAQDDRPSSEAIGILGIALISLTFFLITLPDLITVLSWFYGLSRK